MSVPRVRADYDQLGQVAQRFSAASDAAANTLKSLQQNMQVLEGGDWAGQGARAFYQEMSQSVLPALKRLADALRAGQQTAHAISREMKQAEDAAAVIFRGVGTAGSAAQGVAASAAGSAALPDGGGFGAVAGGSFNSLWDSVRQPMAEARGSGRSWAAISRGALFPVSPAAGAGRGQSGEVTRAAEVADVIRSARLAASSNLSGRFAGAVEAACALGQAAPGSQDAAQLANDLARQSTHIQDPATRVVLGKWEQAGGGIGEAQANGGVWFEPAHGVYQAAGKQAAWETNQAFLRQMMEYGVGRLEFHGLDIEQELLNFDGQPFDAAPAQVKGIRYLMEAAARYGYARQGNSFVRV